MVDETDDIKESFYEDLYCAFNQFPKYHTKILFGDFNDKVGREDICKPTTGNENLQEISNQSNKPRHIQKSNKCITIPHHNIHKFM
jgi:hypothetical protein